MLIRPAIRQKFATSCLIMEIGSTLREVKVRRKHRRRMMGGISFWSLSGVYRLFSDVHGRKTTYIRVCINKSRSIFLPL